MIESETMTNQTHEQQLSRIAWLARTGYAILAWLFVASLFLQVYFAGSGLLVNPTHLSLHTTFAHIMESSLFVMLVLSLLGRLPRRLIALTGGAIMLFMLQYFFIYSPVEIGPVALRALHPTNALALFAVAIYLARQGRRSLNGHEGYGTAVRKYKLAP